MHAFASGTVFYLGIYNPLGVEELPTSRYVADLLQNLLGALILVSVASLLVRRLRATGVERQQLKWITYSTALTVIGVALTYVISETTGSVWLGWVGYVLGLVGFLGIPISMGIAILRYRLYEIDLIINRTLVYGLLTATLAILYFGSATALQYLFSLLTGQGNRSTGGTRTGCQHPPQTGSLPSFESPVARPAHSFSTPPSPGRRGRFRGCR